MKFYKNKLRSAEQVQVQKQREIEVQQMPAAEPVRVTSDQEARIKFMQNIVRQARVDQ